jgi:hypothetical protein
MGFFRFVGVQMDSAQFGWPIARIVGRVFRKNGRSAAGGYRRKPELSLKAQLGGFL